MAGLQVLHFESAAGAFNNFWVFSQHRKFSCNTFNCFIHSGHEGLHVYASVIFYSKALVSTLELKLKNWHFQELVSSNLIGKRPSLYAYIVYSIG
jgi:hypothetical protein